jgi:hypothetical protein|uniref:DUF3604 domain-containing protein n=1 Tax=uncultured marine bacterium EB0_39H12 TaxID=415437 RepID=A4GI08_9BACT|nr:hypothetical protein MBMO_EB0-39H12.0095 [uncultured marine bacterium EB0_39H12]
MINFYRILISVFLLFGLWSCTSPNDIVDYTEDLAVTDPEPGSTAGFSEDKNVYFGDLHVHTKHSFDAYIFGTTATPDDAYEYAKGNAIQHPLGYDMQLREPLDFYAVTDHGFLLGSVEGWADPNNGRAGTEPFHNLNAPENLNQESIVARSQLFQNYVRNIAQYSNIWTRAVAYLTGDTARGSTIYDVDIHRTAWKDVIQSAQRHNDPGNFTTFVAYEFTASTTRSANTQGASALGCLLTGNGCNFEGSPPLENANLHRNVIYKGNKFTVEPFTRLKSVNPENLWSWMDDLRDNGVDTIAIPHNSNGSNGQMFEMENWEGLPISTQYAEFRMRNEPLVEMTQVKGTSETHPILSPNDEWADFEIMWQRVGNSAYSRPFGSYVRQAYLDGLGMEEEGRGNPYKFGMVGASDTHTGAISDDESDFHSKVGLLDGTAVARGSVPISDQQVQDLTGGNSIRQLSFKKIGDRNFNNTIFNTWGASGIAAVWAEENTRDSIFDAFRRKETYATSGSRIKLRFFGGYDLDTSILSKDDLIQEAYKKGVPMGQDLAASEGKAPSFLIWAMRDKNAAPLQRIQIIKGWVEKTTGRPFEEVIDVACSDGLAPDPVTNRCPDNGALVDISDCSISSDRGANEIKTVWTDDSFDSSVKSFYYVRVLENPSCRWSTWDAVKNGTEPREDLQPIIQERAWSSPIWYSY